MNDDRKILLVEDEAMNSMYLAGQLRRMGFKSVECVYSAEAALESVKRERPDLVLMDINLGGQMSGIEAARGIKLLHDIPVIFLSGYSDPKIRAGAEALDPVAFLVKPIDLRELKRLMDVTMENGSPPSS